MKALRAFGFPECIRGEIHAIAFGALAGLAPSFCWSWRRSWSRSWFWLRSWCGVVGSGCSCGRLSVSSLSFLTFSIRPFFCRRIRRRPTTTGRADRSCRRSTAVSTVNVKAVAALRWFERVGCERCAWTRTTLACTPTSTPASSCGAWAFCWPPCPWCNFRPHCDAWSGSIRSGGRCSVPFGLFCSLTLCLFCSLSLSVISWSSACSRWPSKVSQGTSHQAGQL